jgi:hypothetical protein
MLEEVVVDIFNALKFLVRHLFFRREYVRMKAVKTFDVTDKLETLDPLIGTQQIEIRGTDKINWNFVAIKEPPDIGNSV